MTTLPTLPLDLLPARLAVARLMHDAPVPEWATASAVLSAVVRTHVELSVVTEEARVPEDVPAERSYRAFRVHGPLPFDLVGIFASMTGPLAAAGIPIFALSTFDTDYVLVRSADLAAARTALEGAGHTVREVAG